MPKQSNFQESVDHTIIEIGIMFVISTVSKGMILTKHEGHFCQLFCIVVY